MRQRLAAWIASLTALLAVALGCASLARAQPAWPAVRPITIIVPFSAGGSVDATARVLAQDLVARLGQAVVVENIAGAGGTIGVARAVQSAPDGYTLVMGADSPIAIAPLVNPTAVRYDALKDLAPVGLVTTAPMVLAARPGLPAGNLAEVLALARAQPGKLTYATSGIGTVLHLAMEMIKERAKADIVHVPYRGGAQIVTDLAGNQVDLAMLVSISAMPGVTGGRLKAIAVTGARRLPALADVPALAESPGFEGFDVVTWAGLFAPARTPAAIIERLNRALNEALASEAVRTRLAEQGAVAGSGDASAFAAFVRAEQARYARIVRTANIRE